MGSPQTIPVIYRQEVSEKEQILHQFNFFTQLTQSPQ